MYVKLTKTFLSRGTSTPAIRAKPVLLSGLWRPGSPLPLLVLRIAANDQHDTIAANDLTPLAAWLDRGTYLHYKHFTSMAQGNDSLYQKLG